MHFEKSCVSLARQHEQVRITSMFNAVSHLFENFGILIVEYVKIFEFSKCTGLNRTKLMPGFENNHIRIKVSIIFFLTYEHIKCIFGK